MCLVLSCPLMSCLMNLFPSYSAEDDSLRTVPSQPTNDRTAGGIVTVSAPQVPILDGIG